MHKLSIRTKTDGAPAWDRDILCQERYDMLRAPAACLSLSVRGVCECSRDESVRIGNQ